VYLLRRRLPAFLLFEDKPPGFLGEPGEALEVTAIGAPESPSSAASDDRLAVFNLSVPAAIAALLHLSSFTRFVFRSRR
jgi:hypothetical protein